MQSPLARFVLLLFSTSTFLELFCFFVRLFHRLANLSLLLACLDSDCQIVRLAIFCCFTDSAFGFFPVCCTRADLVPNKFY
jgi:hypothetical protein